MIEEAVERHSPGYQNGLSVGRRISSLTRGALERLLPKARSDRGLFIEERIAIGQKKEVILVNCAGRRFLLATAADVVASMGEVLPCPGPKSGGESFGSSQQQESL